MSYKKILLLNPYIPKSYLGPVRPPASLGYIAEYLGSNDIQYDVIDMNLGYKMQHLWKKIEYFNPDFIGITVWSYRYKNTLLLIKAIREKYPRIKVIAGGPHISTLRTEALSECKEIDFGIVLEGEIALHELCNDKKPEEIKGLIYREGKDIIFNGERDFITSLDSLPFPKYDKFELKKYMLEEILIISSRGCPYECIYCPVNLAIGKRLRIRSASDVVDEIEYWYNKYYRRFNFGDDNFTFFKDRVYQICDEIEKRKLKELDLRCGNGIRADKVDRPLLKRMKEVGFKYLAFGVEAGNNRMLKILRKGESIEQIDQAIKDACELGYDVTLFFLAGSPGETYSDIMDSVRLAEKYPVFDARFYNVVPYPGTQLFRYLKENNLLIRNPVDYLNDASVFSLKPIFKTPELPVRERIGILKWLHKIERRILRKGIKRKLSKYGLLGALAAYLCTKDFLYYIIRHNKLLRRIIERARYDLGQAINAESDI